MTNNLELITQSKVEIEIISEKIVNKENLSILYEEIINEFSNPVIERKVLIKNTNNENLILATSLWNNDDYLQIMKEKKDAIGNNMILQKIEYFREIKNVGIIQNFKEARNYYSETNYKSKFRTYIMYNNKKKLTYIEELFLPDIEKYFEK